jgi:hypothetical protein
MLGNRKLVVDTMSEVYQELKPWADAEFWDFAEHEPVPNSVYVLGRLQVVENIEKFKKLAQQPDFVMIFGNSAEGSSPLVSQICMLGLEQLVLDRHVLLIGGGDMESRYPHIQHDHFLCRILHYEENIKEIEQATSIFTKTHKPYNFMFLNGRARAHRKYLWERFRQLGLLDHALYTVLDSRPTPSRHFTLIQNNVDLMTTTTPLKWLPREYEVEQFRNTLIASSDQERVFVKNELFDNQWGEIYLQAEPYTDTYFSVVTETVFDYPYSFRTEKIAKPLAIGHPWIVASNVGFYRDMRNLGFRTFNGIIDESFDTIDNHQARMDRIVEVVADLCQQDLSSFLAACEDICKYNQQHLQQVSAHVKSQFADRFFNFIEQHRP